jgi:hypothetical protein
VSGYYGGAARSGIREISMYEILASPFIPQIIIF